MLFLLAVHMIHFTYLCRWVITSTNTIFLWFSLPAAFYAFLMYHFTWKLRIWGIGDLWKITASLYHKPDFNLKCELSEHCSDLFLLPRMIPTEFCRIICYRCCSTQHFSEPQRPGITAQAKQACSIDICMFLDWESEMTGDHLGVPCCTMFHSC